MKNVFVPVYYSPPGGAASQLFCKNLDFSWSFHWAKTADDGPLYKPTLINETAMDGFIKLCLESGLGILGPYWLLFILKLSTHTEQIFRLLLKISVYGGHLLRLTLFILELPSGSFPRHEMSN